MKTLFFSILFSCICFLSYSQCVTTADFVAVPANGCSTPHTVFFTDQSNKPDTWKWEFGDGASSTAQNPVHTYTKTGIFTVKLTVVDTVYGCSFTHTKQIFIIIPIADFIVNKSFGCGPLNVNFTDQSTNAVKWEWDFGDGSSSDQQNPSHTYDNPGSYDVSLTITASNGCTKTKTNTNFIQVIGPTPDFSVNETEGCNALSVEFTDNSKASAPIIDRNWNFGDGASSSSLNPTHEFSSAGEYSVSLTLEDLDGCSRTITKDDLISVHPNYSSNKTVTICSGESVTFPDGTTKKNIKAAINYTSTLASNKGCDSIIITKVKVNPTYNLTKTVSICSGESYTFPDGSTKNNITLKTTQTSNLSSKKGCDSIIVTTININPTYNLTKTDSVCSGESYTFPDGTIEHDIETEIVHTSNLSSKKGCDSVVVTTVKVISIDNSTRVSGSTIGSLMENADFQWINCSDNAIIDTETDSSFTASISGDYAVEITYKNCKDTSECQSIIGLGLVENEFGNALSVFPNPSTGNLVTDLSDGTLIKEVKLYDLTGQELLIESQNSGAQVSLNITQPSGYYILEIISTDHKRARIKILKN